MGRRKNRKRRKARKERKGIEELPKVKYKKGGSLQKYYKGVARGGVTLSMGFSPVVVRVDDPSDPTAGLEEKTKAQEALLEELPDRVH